MPARTIPKRHGIKNPAKMTKWQKKLVGRGYARKEASRKREAGGKPALKPLAEPLTMSKHGIVKGSLVLKNGRRKIAVQMVREHEALQGVYRLNGKIVVARSRSGKAVYPEKIRLYELNEDHEKQIHDDYENAYFEIANVPHDIGHLYLPEEYRQTGLAERHASRTDRHDRQKKPGQRNTFYMSRHRTGLFEKLLKRIGYRQEKIEKHDIWIYDKKGKVSEKTNMNRFHLIEAIDPATGKKREYAFPIKKN